MQFRRLPVVVAALVTAGFVPAGLSAARGDLDPTFGSGGKVMTDFGGTEIAWAVALQRDGRIIVAGDRLDQRPSDDFLLARYTAKGSLDPSFDGDGKVATDFGGRQDGAYDVEIQRDGRIVVAGSSRQGGGSNIALARYKPDGSLDPTFGSGGKVLTSFGAGGFDDAHAVSLQRDGKVVAAGGTRSGPTRAFALARFLPNGALDQSFGSSGRVTTPIPGRDNDRVFALAVQPDGKLVAAGGSYEGPSDVVLARYSQAGHLDPTFGSDGIAVASFRPKDMVPLQVAVQRDGKLLATGYGGMTRFTADGRLDRRFTEAAAAVSRIVQPAAAAIQPDGRIIVAGTSGGRSDDFGVARLTTAGRLDPTYGRSGVVSTDFRSGSADHANDAVLSSDGKLTVAGATGPAWDFAVARYVATAFCVVPNVRGRALRAARTVLARAACRVGEVRRRYSRTVAKGRVISQRPRAGARLAEATKVDLVISRGRR